MAKAPPDAVTVTAPARLHLGFFDLEGGLGRRFGSLGLTLDGLSTRVVVRRDRGLTAVGPGGERACRTVECLARAWDMAAAGRIEITHAIPAHAGLGSGTQLALAVGTGFAALHGRPPAAAALAVLLGRGRRSGIGVAAFEGGGVVVDGGRGAARTPPPLLCRHAFPAAWRLLLVFDTDGAGLAGEREVEAFRRLPPFPAALAGQCCRLLVMQALPALVEHDFEPFAAAVGALQAVVGGHFAPVQGGAIASPAVAEVLDWLGRQGFAGTGQSSWGPTGFALLPDQITAERVLAALQGGWSGHPTLSFAIHQGRNQGAVVEPLP